MGVDNTAEGEKAMGPSVKENKNDRKIMRKTMDGGMDGSSQLHHHGFVEGWMHPIVA